MSDIYFPDFGQALAASSAMRQRDADTEYRNEMLRMKREDAAREQADAPHVAAALKGDRTAIDRVSPSTAIKLFPMMEKLDAQTRLKAKEAADFTLQSAMGVLQAPPEQRAQAYGLAMEEAKRRGYDTSSWPQQWTPQTEGWVNFQVNKARPIADYFKEQGKGLDPIPGPGDAGAVIGGMESGGRYDAVGPDTGGGKRAYGKYQVMDFNIGPWTQEVLGKAMSPQEFLANPQAQDAVFKAKFGQYRQQFGSDEAAARAWFAGPGGMNNPNAKDVLGTTVAGYAQKFNAGMGVPQGDTPTADGSGTPLPPQDLKEQIRGLNLPKGYRVRTVGGIPVVKDGTVLVTGPDGRPDFVPLPQRAAPKESTGPFAGTSMDAQAMNILLTGDPASPQYALAYSHLSKPRTTLDDQGRMVTIQPMDLSSVRKPAAIGGAAPAPAAGSAPAPGATTVPIPGGGTATVTDEPLAPKGPSANEMAKLRTARAEAEKITAAAEDFRQEWQKATPADRARALAGANTPLNAAYNNFALLAKGDALFQLGVLNGPDLDIIRRTIPDPSTLKSGITTDNDMAASVDKVLKILNGGIAAHEKQLGIRPDKKGAYTGPNNSIVSWEEIEATAKGRGISTDEVISRLGLKPAGAR